MTAPRETAAPPRPGSSTGVATRAATAGALLVARRRARADAGLLALGATVLAVSVALSVVIPRTVARTADDAVQQGVAAIGTSADLVARIGTNTAPGFESSDVGSRNPNDAAELRRTVSKVHDALPPELAAVVGPGTATVATNVVNAIAGTTPIATRLVYVGVPDEGRQDGLVEWVDGRAPDAADLEPDDPASEGVAPRQIEVGMQADAAELLGVQVGDEVRGRLTTRNRVDVVVTGLYTVADEHDVAWVGLEDLVGPQPAADPTQQEGRAALLVTPRSLPDVNLNATDSTLLTQVRYPTDPDAIDTSNRAAVRAAITRVQADPTTLRQSDGRHVTVTTALGTALDEIGGRLAAARAQQSVVVLGIAGVAALVLVLAARLLVTRRETYLLAERARGASLASVAVRALVESVPLALLAGGLGLLAAGLVLPGPTLWSVAAGLVAVAAAAPAVVAVLAVRRAWSGRRQPANRSDRARVASRRRARRWVAELALIALAVAAVVSVRRRGLLTTGSGGVDPLLAAAPLLVAAAATIVVVHALPPLLRAAANAAGRTRGVVPLVATARASTVAGTVVPLMALTTAVGLLVFSGTTTVTVQAGQATAALERIGADVRVEGELTEQDVTALRAADGVTSVAALAVLGSRSLGSSTGVTVDVVLADADELATIGATHDHPIPGLTDLVATDGTVPALVSASVEPTTRLVRPTLRAADGRLELSVVGLLGAEPYVTTTGPAATGRLLVDRATFDAAQGTSTAPSTILVDGPGASAAVVALALTERPDVTVTTRADWLRDWSSTPLNDGLVTLLRATAAILAAYAALALVLLVVATSGDRGRTLSALRTLGLDGRTARALTFAEVAPLAGAALVAGTVIGVGIPWLLSGALGLDVATGGLRPPATSVGWWPLVAAVAAVVVALVVAVLVESAVRRRDRLGEVLRVGER
ncbi:FtsX-like permease family protein [Cellulomonas composti]|uniref:ABC3 transporter permease C-terminal domain-containing protein n=1 Tax=Cellulomonas composti TaxID=266130 RepID=A0A511JAV4_9CELL|nr:FtsX-like permease family protein [Cellulomonas composti]GEL94909.1 hypothetical protein CCO02nite_15670 [Cellulomonas composti]